MARKKNENAPHQTIILIQAEVMERLHDGRVSGIPVDRSSKVYTITGKNYEDCKKQTEEVIQKINEVFNDRKEN